MNDDLDKLRKEYQDIKVPPEIDFAIEKGIKKGKRRKSIGREYIGLAAAVLICIMSLFIFKLKESSFSYKEYQQEPAEINLSILGSSENLLKIFKDSSSSNIRLRGDVAYGIAEKSASSKDYSTTNNQVEGVDEEDTVQTDGEFIYSINAINSSINIVRAYPTSKMELINKIDLEKSFSPSGIFLYNDYLVAIGNAYPSTNGQSGNKIYSMKLVSSNTWAVIYNIKDKKNIKKVREVKIEGGYATSRIAEGNLFIISNKFLNRDIIIKDKRDGEVRIEDSTVKEEIVNSYDKIKYVGGSDTGSYINVT